MVVFSFTLAEFVDETDVHRRLLQMVEQLAHLEDAVSAWITDCEHRVQAFVAHVEC